MQETDEYVSANVLYHRGMFANPAWLQVETKEQWILQNFVFRESSSLSFFVFEAVSQ